MNTDENKTVEEKAVPSALVQLKITKGDDVTEKSVVFNTPLLLAEIEAAPPESRILITVNDPGASEPRTLADDTRENVIETIKTSIVPPGKIAEEVRKFVQFITDHSTLKGIGVNAVYRDDNGDDAGFGFAVTAHDCTMAQAVALVNCGDANMDEFVARAKISIPGRHGTKEDGPIAVPTAEQITAVEASR